MINSSSSYSSSFTSHLHKPVLLKEMLENLSPKNGEVYVDGTFGAGGYTRALLESCNCTVYAIDRDPDVQIFAEKLANEFAGRINFIIGNFSDMAELLESKGVKNVDGIVLDIGVSSMQIDSPERGFSFSHDGPLDMRMGKHGKSAAYLVNEGEEKNIADIIYNYGGERMSRKIARAIVQARQIKPITRTSELAEIIRRTVRKYNDKIDPATRTFQAIRIWVNDELEELTKALEAAERILSPGGRIVVITFHSLEDSIVKNYLKEKIWKSGNLFQIPTFTFYTK